MSILLTPHTTTFESPADTGNRILGFVDTRVVLIGILLLAFLGRALVRFYYGEADFWTNSYSLFYTMAEWIAAGRGLCYEWIGVKCAHRPPVYPMFLVLSVLAGKSFILIVILQSIMGAATALCAYLIGKDLFNRDVGLLAALGVSIYPYFVMHDTALQETGMFTFLTALAMLLLLRVRKSPSKVTWVMAGIALGLAVLTRVTLVGFVPFAFLWVLLIAASTWRLAIVKTTLVALGFLLVLSPWLMRNYFLLGTPALSTLSGLTLWAGNNPHTFSRYPIGSIDRSVDVATQELPQADKDAIDRLANEEVGQNAWFLQMGTSYMKEHPGQTLARAFTKIGAAYSWRLNPGRETFVQTVYFLSYVPTLLLALAGVWWSRHKWKELSLIYALFFSFTALTAIFFSHTSHRVYLDVYLFIFAGYALVRIFERLKGKVPAKLPAQHA